MAGVIQVSLYPINLDSAWLLYVAARTFDGAAPYVAYVETNPPLMLLLSMPAAFVARVTGESPIFVYKAQTLLVAVGSLWLCALIMARSSSVWPRAPRAYAFALFAYVIFVHPGVHAGQREHLLLIGLIPYLLLCAARITEPPLGRIIPVVVGLLAGLGFAFKPHFLLVWIAIESAVAARIGLAHWRCRAELWAVLGIFVGYAGVIVFAFPEYITLARDILLPTYPHFYSRRWSFVILSGYSFFCALALALYFAKRPGRRAGELGSMVVAALVPMVLVVWFQKRGWGYHWYPATGLAILLIGLCLGDHARQRSGWLGLPRRVIQFGVVAGLLASAVIEGNRARKADATPEWQATERMIAVIRRHAPRGSIAVLSTRFQEIFPLVSYAAVDYNLRFVPLWPLVGILEASFKAGRGGETLPAMRGVERFLIDGVASDFAQRPADLVIIDTSPLVTDYGRMAIDYIAYFSVDGRFRKAIADYEFLLAEGNKIVLQRVPPSRDSVP